MLGVLTPSPVILTCSWGSKFYCKRVKVSDCEECFGISTKQVCTGFPLAAQSYGGVLKKLYAFSLKLAL